MQAKVNEVTESRWAVGAAVVMWVIAAVVAASGRAAGGEFDVPTIAVARPTLTPGSTGSPADAAGDVGVSRELVVEIPVCRVPAALDNDRGRRVEHWIVELRPRGRFGPIVDYAPRTETTTLHDGPDVVKTSSETLRSGGISADAAYGHWVSGHAGLDRSDKAGRVVESRVRPTESVLISSGTFDRGRGVRFRLDRSPVQPLEGERRFALSFRAPAGWRGGLIDVSVVAAGTRAGELPWSSERPFRHEETFVVAVHRGGDDLAAADAAAVQRTEDRLRRLVGSSRLGSSRLGSSSIDSTPSGRKAGVIGSPVDWLRPMIDGASAAVGGSTLDDAAAVVADVIAGRRHVHHDRDLRRLPMGLRIAALDYAESVRRLEGDDRTAGRPRHSAAKVAIE